MRDFLAVLMGFAAGWYLCWKWLRAGRAWQLPAALTRWRDRVLVHWRRAVPAAPPVAAAPAEPLSTRLHRLQAVLIPEADNSAHPRELEDQAEFRLAVRLLQDAGVSIDTVLQYAFGAIGRCPAPRWPRSARGETARPSSTISWRISVAWFPGQCSLP